MDEYLARQGRRGEIEEWFAEQGLLLPLSGLARPQAIWARQVATAMYCDHMFHDLATRMGFNPLWAEWVDDLYDSKNEYKQRLLQRVIAGGQGRSGGVQTEHHRLLGRMRLAEIEGQPLSTILTDEGHSLVEFHHGLRPSEWQQFDLSSWVVEAGASPKKFYLPFLAMFLAHGILVENFHESGKEHNQGDKFTAEVFWPAFSSLNRKFGIRPIIVRLPWHPSSFHYPRPGQPWIEQAAIPPEFRARVWEGAA
jgi:hypothetical protein